jgi:hypothetical protein
MFIEADGVFASKPAPTFEMHSPVGAAAGCDLLILKKHQKIAAFGSSYRDGGRSCNIW